MMRCSRCGEDACTIIGGECIACAYHGVPALDPRDEQIARLTRELADERNAVRTWIARKAQREQEIARLMAIPVSDEQACPQCGVGVASDEDGCCASCGATLCGAWVREAFDRLTRGRDAAEREADRLRHGVPIEGDFVCPHELRADIAERELAEARAVIARRERETCNRCRYWKPWGKRIKGICEVSVRGEDEGCSEWYEREP